LVNAQDPPHFPHLFLDKGGTVVQFNLAGVSLVGVVVETRRQQSVVRVDGTLWTVETASLRPFPSRKGA
jgi:hypothetical protein